MTLFVTFHHFHFFWFHRMVVVNTFLPTEMPVSKYMYIETKFHLAWKHKLTGVPFLHWSKTENTLLGTCQSRDNPAHFCSGIASKSLVRGI